MAAEKTLHKLNLQFLIRKEISTKVKKKPRNCQSCTLYSGRRETPAPFGKYPIQSRPFKTVAFDYPGPFRATEERNKYIFVFTDYLMRFNVIFALPNKTTENVTKMMKKLIKTYDCPQTMISDNIAEFTSKAVIFFVITRYKKAGSCTMAPKFKPTCQKDKWQIFSKSIAENKKRKIGMFL